MAYPLPGNIWIGKMMHALTIDVARPKDCRSCFAYHVGTVAKWCAACKEPDDRTYRRVEDEHIRPEWCPIIGELDEQGLLLLVSDHMGIDFAEVVEAMKRAGECRWDLVLDPLNQDQDMYSVQCLSPDDVVMVFSSTNNIAEAMQYCPYCGRQVKTVMFPSVGK